MSQVSWAQRPRQREQLPPRTMYLLGGIIIGGRTVITTGREQTRRDQGIAEFAASWRRCSQSFHHHHLLIHCSILAIDCDDASRARDVWDEEQGKLVAARGMDAGGGGSSTSNDGMLLARMSRASHPLWGGTALTLQPSFAHHWSTGP